MPELLPVLYSFRRCPYAMRARMALVSAGIKMELREVHLKNKPQPMLEASPKGTVPVVVLPDGTVIEESMDVIHWALDQNDPENLKKDWSEEATAEMEEWITYNDKVFIKALAAYKYPDRFPGTNKEEARADAEEFLQKIEDRLQTRKFLFGDRCSWGDIALLPFIRQFAKVDEGWFDGAPYPKLQSWMKGFLESEAFEKVMLRVDPWEPEGDAAPVIFGA